jgi:hypothetical protein
MIDFVSMHIFEHPTVERAEIKISFCPDRWQQILFYLVNLPQK